MNSITPTSNFTGMINCSVSGVSVSGPDNNNYGGFYLKAHPSNTALVWIFDDGSNASAGFPLNAGELIFVPILNLNLLDFSAEAANQNICFIQA